MASDSLFSVSWIISALLSSIPYALWTTVSVYYFSTFYLIFRRYKYGIIVKGKITKMWNRISTNDTNEEIQYYLNVTYKDDRQEITHKYLNRLMTKFINTHNHNTYIPKDITNVCMEYIVNSFQFYYGPYTSKHEIPSHKYDQFIKGDTIDLRFDAKYPQNVEIYDDSKDFINCCGVLWQLLCICIVCGGIAYGLRVQLHYSNNSNHERRGMILIIFVVSLVMTVVVNMVCCFKKKYFCFKKGDKELQIWNEIQDLNIEVSDTNMITFDESQEPGTDDSHQRIERML